MTRRVPALFLEIVVAVEQDLKSLKVADIVEKQRPAVPSVQAEGMEQVCEFSAPNSRRDRYSAAPEQNML